MMLAISRVHICVGVVQKVLTLSELSDEKTSPVDLPGLELKTYM
jgi:hypothetical protein